LVGIVFSQTPTGCIDLSKITKWEVIASSEVIAYAGDVYVAIVSIADGYMTKGEPVTLRFLSPSLCRSDTIIVNGYSTTVSFIKSIRGN